MSAAHPPIRLLRNVATSRIVRALEQDGFRFVERQGSQTRRSPSGWTLRRRPLPPRQRHPTALRDSQSAHGHPLERGRPPPPQADQIARRSTPAVSGRPCSGTPCTGADRRSPICHARPGSGPRNHQRAPSRGWRERQHGGIDLRNPVVRFVIPALPAPPPAAACPDGRSTGSLTKGPPEDVIS